jgi:hypothetical protein
MRSALPALKRRKIEKMEKRERERFFVFITFSQPISILSLRIELVELGARNNKNAIIRFM